MQDAISNTVGRQSGYHKLIAWQKADELAHKIYDITQGFPSNELFGLTSQVRRASLSVPANIVEGFSRVNKNEFRHFLSITLGSLAELGYFMEFAYKRKLITNREYEMIVQLKEDCGKLIWGLYKSQK